MVKGLFDREIELYNELLECLREIEAIRLDVKSPKESLAFLIEEMKHKNPESWEEDVFSLMEKIRELNLLEGKAGVTWFLTGYINSIYINFLDRRKEKFIDDRNTLEIIEIMKEMTHLSTEFGRKSYEEGQPVTFGGISGDYIPQWYEFVSRES
ncbi:MAG: hypothetical protein ABRQ37_09950 [Candidatus Eremiobacterota bacterium]